MDSSTVRRTHGIPNWWCTKRTLYTANVGGGGTNFSLHSCHRLKKIGFSFEFSISSVWKTENQISSISILTISAEMTFISFHLLNVFCVKRTRPNQRTSCLKWEKKNIKIECAFACGSSSGPKSEKTVNLSFAKVSNGGMGDVGDKTGWH